MTVNSFCKYRFAHIRIINLHQQVCKAMNGIHAFHLLLCALVFKLVFTLSLALLGSDFSLFSINGFCQGVQKITLG